MSIMGLLAFALVGTVMSDADMNLAFRWVILIGLVTLGLSLFYDGIFIPGLPLSDTIEYKNVFDHQDFMDYRRVGIVPYAATDAAVLALGFLAAYLVSNQRKKGRRLAILCVVTILLHLSIIQARWILANGIAVFSCVGLLNFVSTRRVRISRRIIGLAGLVLATVTALAFVSGFDFLSRGAVNEDLTRRQLYHLGWEGVVHGPLLGSGFGASAESLEKAGGLVDSISGTAFGAHNTYILVGLEMGIVGLMGWIAMLTWSLLSWARFVIKGLHNSSPNRIYQLDLLVIGFVGLSLILGGLFHTLINVPWLWYMLLYDFRKRNIFY
jgi:O-antigen ligase